MYKKQITYIIGSVLAIVLCAVWLLFKNVNKFPEYQIDLNSFYGLNDSNIKDYSRNDFTLISMSDDAWVLYPIDDTFGIYEIAIDIKDVSISWNWTQIFLGGDWEDSAAEVHPGLNYFKFGRGVGPKYIPYIRFDLTAEPSVSISVDSIVINPHGHMIKEWLKDFLLIVLTGVSVCISLILAYMKRLEYEENKLIRKVFLLGFSGLQMIALLGVGYRYYRLGYFDLQLLYLSISLMCESLLSSMLLKGVSGKRWDNIPAWLLFGGMSFMFIEAISGTPINNTNPRIILFNMLLCALPCIILWCVFGNHGIIWIAAGLLWLILAVVNHFYYVFRGQAFELIDLKMAGTAATVIKNYRFDFFVVLYAIIAELIALIFAVVITRSENKASKKGRVAAAIAAIAFIILIRNSFPEVSLWDTNSTTKENGYVFSFSAYAEKSFRKPVPEGYSVKNSEEILSRYYYSDSSVEMAENVIVIMNEAFSDLPSSYGFETDEDCMPFVHSLEGKNTAKGNMLVSIFGGTTSNTEYEFLTGNSMAFLNSGDVPYVQYISHDMPSLARLLYNQGFCAEAFHPYSDQGYKRYLVYPLFGFEEFYTQDDELLNKDLIRNYISDSADYKDVIDFCNHKTSERWFMFNVTMQNHGGYSTGPSSVPTTVKPVDPDLQISSLEEYLSLIKESDNAFRELIEYYETCPQKTIILMFGDHQPGLDSAAFNTINSKAPALSSWIEQEVRKLTVPYVLWANYDLPEEMPVVTSPNYLRVLLLRQAGISLSNYDQLIYECYKEYPAINIAGFYDKKGVFHKISELDSNELLMDYKKCAYYNLFEEANLDWDYFQ